MPDLMLKVAPTIKVGGTPLSDSKLGKLTHMRVDMEMGLTGRCTLRFADFGSELASSGGFSLGTAVVVADALGIPVFTGVITGVSLDQGGGRLPEFVVVADDKSYKLGLKTQTKAYLNQTYGAIVATLASDIGLAPSSLIPDTTMNQYLLQSGTNLDFLNEICARAGRAWWVDGLGTMLNFQKIGTSASVPTALVLGDDLESFSVRATANHPDQVEVVGWDPDQQAEISGTAQAPTAPESTFVTGYPGRTSGSNKVVVRDEFPLTASEATAIATSIQKNAQAEAVTAHGSGEFNGGIKVGGKIMVAQAGPATGSYTVTAVEHTYDGHGFKTSFTCGSYRPSHLVDVLDGGDRPTGMAIHGVLTGVVTNVADPEKKGQVKVKYSTQGTTVESPWARVATPGAGKARGFEFLPEVNDEVLIAFEQGDTRRPVVIAGLYSSKNTLPPSKKPGNIDGTEIAYRRITSRLGHVLEFADGKDEATKHIKLALDGKEENFFRIGADKVDLTIKELDITITNGKASLTLKKDGSIELKGEEIKIVANKNAGVEAQQNVTLKGNQKVSIQGQQGFEIKGTQGQIEGQGQLALKGGMVQIN